jgi:hypothetical protein
MKNHRITKNNFLIHVLSILLPFGFFSLILTIKIPVYVARSLTKFQLIHFLILLFIFFISFRFIGKSAWIIGCSLTLVLFGLQLASKWTLGISNANIIGGFIPYKDGFYYYNGARMLLAGQAITGEGLQGAFRPLYPGLLSVLLLLLNNNLILVIAVVVSLTALCCFMSSFLISRKFGPLPAALFLVSQYAFIRPMIGYSLTEVPSLIFSCLAFILLISGAEQKKYFDIILGGFLLVLAISVRAGPFFVLPIIILWTGWLFRIESKIDFKRIIIFGLIFSAEFLVVNFIFPRLVTATSSSTFGNFSWMLYGQAVGGAGWSYHLEALGTHDSIIVMQAAIEKIKNYPLGLIIGSYKSLRDFILPGKDSMFSLIHYKLHFSNYLFWTVKIFLLVLGLVHSIRRVQEPKYSLILSIFIGTLFSIPFLPPIDGGNRFFSGIAPFFFIIESIGLFSMISYLNLRQKPKQPQRAFEVGWVRAISGIMISLILIAPIGVFFTRHLPAFNLPVCKNDQIPFATQTNKGMYIDIIPEDNDTCGFFPIYCLADFEHNGLDKDTDDFFQKLVELTRNSKNGIRLFAAVDLISKKYNFTIIPINDDLKNDFGYLYSGCAKEIKTQYQTIHYVETIHKQTLLAEIIK